MRVATKYPRIARALLRGTGRQAEIVEVKGSVELAPLTGLVEAIVDLTATGTTLRENGLVVREEIVASTARLIANPVAHKLKAAAIDDAAWSALRARLSGCALSDAGARGAARAARAGARRPRRCADAVAEIVAAVRARRRRGAARATCERFDGGDGAAARSPPSELDAALARARRRRPRRARGRDRQRRARVAEAGARRRRARSTLPQGQTRRAARGAGAARRGLRARRPRRRTRRRVVMGVVTARAAGVDEVVVCAPGAHPVILAAVRAVRRRRGLRDGRRAGGRRARLRDRDDPARRRDRRARATSTCRRPSARSSRRRRDRRLRRARATCSCSPPAAPTPSSSALDLLAQAEHGEGTLVVRRSATTPALLDALARARRRAGRRRGARWSTRRTSTAALAFAEAFAPEHLQLVGAAAEALAPRVRSAGCVFVGAASGDRVRRLRRGLEPHAADRAARRASPPGSRRATSAAG